MTSKAAIVKILTAAARGEITAEEAALLLPIDRDLIDIIFINVLCTSAYIMLFVILERLLK